ncbi:hypothetical protein V8G54_007926, partial [Vigna mungo]
MSFILFGINIIFPSIPIGHTFERPVPSYDTHNPSRMINVPAIISKIGMIMQPSSLKHLGNFLSTLGSLQKVIIKDTENLHQSNGRNHLYCSPKLSWSSFRMLNVHLCLTYLIMLFMNVFMYMFLHFLWSFRLNLVFNHIRQFTLNITIIVIIVIIIIIIIIFSIERSSRHVVHHEEVIPCH